LSRFSYCLASFRRFYSIAASAASAAVPRPDFLPAVETRNCGGFKIKTQKHSQEHELSIGLNPYFLSGLKIHAQVTAIILKVFDAYLFINKILFQPNDDYLSMKKLS
jgi:hypothetical protein